MIPESPLIGLTIRNRKTGYVATITAKHSYREHAWLILDGDLIYKLPMTREALSEWMRVRKAVAA